MLTVAANGRTGHDPAELAVTARRDGDRWVLDGVQTAVPWAYGADLVVVPAHTDADRTVLALVAPDREGVVLAEQISTTGERLAELRLESVPIARVDVIDAEGAWEWLRDLLTALKHLRAVPRPRHRRAAHDRRIHQQARAVRVPRRDLPGRGRTGRRPLHRPARDGGHPVAGGLADRLGRTGRAAYRRGPGRGEDLGGGGGTTGRADRAASARRVRRRHRLSPAPVPRLGQAPGTVARPGGGTRGGVGDLLAAHPLG